MKNKIVKIIMSIIASLLLIVFSFYLWIVSLFSGNMPFFTIIILAADVSIIGLLISWVKSSFKLLIPFLILLFVVLASFCFRTLYNRYENAIPVLKEQKVVIYEYLPFSKDSKIAKLPMDSNLRLNGILPLIDGATALYPLYSSFVNATYPDNSYDPKDSIVLCSTTSKAYENLIDGKVDVIFCAEPSKEQIEKATSKGINFVLTPIGKEAFVFFVNKKNIVDNISSENIIGVYSGKIKSWKTLGGKNSKIKVFQRPENSGSQTILQKIMGKEVLLPPLKDEIIGGMGDIIERTADYKNYVNAIGYSFLYYSTKMVENGSIKLLSINDIMPSKETIINNTYPYVSVFYAITKENPSDNTKKLIRWILSDEGQYLVEKTGYVPIK